MATTAKKWGSGNVGSTATTMATMSSESGLRLTVMFRSTVETIETISIYLNFGGSDIYIMDFLLPANGSATWRCPPLPDGTIIKALCSTASATTYLVLGGSNT